MHQVHENKTGALTAERTHYPVATLLLSDFSLVRWIIPDLTSQACMKTM